MRILHVTLDDGRRTECEDRARILETEFAIPATDSLCKEAHPAWAAFYSGSPSGPPAKSFQCFKGDLPGPENLSSSEDSVSPFSFGFPHKRFPAPCCPGAIYF